MVHLYQLLVKKAVVYHTLTTFSTDDNDPTSNNSISAFLQKTVMERSNAPLTCCIRKSNHNNHLAKNMMDLQQGDYIFFEIASTVLLYFDIMENVLNKVGHLLSELGFDPHSILIQHHDSETLLLRLVSKIRLPNSIANSDLKFRQQMTNLITKQSFINAVNSTIILSNTASIIIFQGRI